MSITEILNLMKFHTCICYFWNYVSSTFVSSFILQSYVCKWMNMIISMKYCNIWIYLCVFRNIFVNIEFIPREKVKTKLPLCVIFLEKLILIGQQLYDVNGRCVYRFLVREFIFLPWIALRSLAYLSPCMLVG